MNTTSHKISMLVLAASLLLSSQAFAGGHIAKMGLSEEQIIQLKQLNGSGRSLLSVHPVKQAAQNRILTAEQRAIWQEIRQNSSTPITLAGNDVNQLPDLDEAQRIKLKQLKSTGKNQNEVSAIREAKMATVLTKEQRMELKNKHQPNHLTNNEVIQKNSSR